MESSRRLSLAPRESERCTSRLERHFSNAAEAFYCRQRHSVESIVALRPIQCIECSAKAVFIDEWIRRNGDSVDIVNGWSK
ncbi:hypothetical protein XF_2661 [Xylella fastidiosa 9a5c]|uniref:Uncharacterized protein n=1 Tax=Xylella fastidiosa (strain 9a5c) TaxID=160492 RepID=Q9PA59_XYLFA|nr:hypothetical protein XF_2661 [Xylella fastidiosa 9a5c]